MKTKVVKQLDKDYYIQMKQLAPEYEAFFELKKKGWLWDSVVAWSESQEKLDEHYHWIMNNIDSYNNM